MFAQNDIDDNKTGTLWPGKYLIKTIKLTIPLDLYYLKKKSKMYINLVFENNCGETFI